MNVQILNFFFICGKFWFWNTSEDFWQIVTGHKESRIEEFLEDLNPSLALLTDWIITSGNTSLSVDMLIAFLEKMNREDIVEIIEKANGEWLVWKSEHVIHVVLSLFNIGNKISE